MNSHVLKLVSGVFWAASAIAAASPASARAFYNSGTGDYATCSGAWSYASFSIECYDYPGMQQASYSQNIRLVSTSCNAAACADQGGFMYVENVYATGRKSAYSGGYCSNYYSVYGLDSCAC
jgi:hypothetical protein